MMAHQQRMGEARELGDQLFNAVLAFDAVGIRAALRRIEALDATLQQAISMVGSQQLAAVSERLRQRTGLKPSFGGVGVVFSGDFAQLPPIGQRSLIYDPKPGRVGAMPSAPSRLDEAGRRRFAEFKSCVRLRVIYRQGDRARSRSRPCVSATAP